MVNKNKILCARVAIGFEADLLGKVKKELISSLIHRRRLEPMPALLSWSFRARHFHRWGQAVYIFIDCGLAPIDAIRAGHKITYGKKWTIFWGSFLLGITMYVMAVVLFFVFGRTMPAMVVIMGFVMYGAFISAGFQNLYRF